MKNRYTVSPVHGESRSLFHVVDGGAPEDCQPCIVVTLGMRGEADQLAWILSRQAERIRELESAAAVYVRTHEGYAQELKARIRELEGALENTVRLLADVAENPHTGTTTRQVMREHAAHARRILAEGGKP